LERPAGAVWCNPTVYSPTPAANRMRGAPKWNLPGLVPLSGDTTARYGRSNTHSSEGGWRLARLGCLAAPRLLPAKYWMLAAVLANNGSAAPQQSGRHLSGSFLWFQCARGSLSSRYQSIHLYLDLAEINQKVGYPPNFLPSFYRRLSPASTNQQIVALNCCPQNFKSENPVSTFSWPSSPSLLMAKPWILLTSLTSECITPVNNKKHL